MPLTWAWRIVAVLFGSALLAALLGCAATPPPDVLHIRGIRVVKFRQAQVEAACIRGGARKYSPEGKMLGCAFMREGVIAIADNPQARVRLFVCHEIGHILLGDFHPGRDDMTGGPLWDEAAGRCKVAVD